MWCGELFGLSVPYDCFKVDNKSQQILYLFGNLVTSEMALQFAGS